MNGKRAWLAFALAACSGELRPSSDEEAINGPTVPVQQWMIDRAVALAHPDGSLGCTGTRIAPSWVITASHCLQEQGMQMFFYTQAESESQSLTAFVVERFLRPGVQPQNASWPYTPDQSAYYDNTGLFADFALLQLDHDVRDGAAATIEWTYPAEIAADGFKVGAGNHGGIKNTARQLLAAEDTTVTTTDGHLGYFTTSQVQIDHGDSGGPFYVHGRVLGTASGLTSDFTQARYVALPVHLNWILSTIGYRWAGGPMMASQVLSGNVAESITTNFEQVCQYACEQRNDCKGYNWRDSDSTQVHCTLLSSIGGVAASGDTHFALKLGASSRSGNPTAYRRSDGYNSVVHRTSGGHIHELYFGNGQGWTTDDIFGNLAPGLTPAPAVAGNVSPYVRSDGANAIAYRSTDGDIIEIYLSSAGWVWRDLSFFAGVPQGAIGDPAAYTNRYGESAIFYRSYFGQLFMLQPSVSDPASELWTARDLTSFALADPMVYDRSDGYDAVVYVGTDNAVHEISSINFATWSDGRIQWGGPPALGTPSGFVRHDGINDVVFRGNDGTIWDVSLQLDGWHTDSVSNQCGGPTAAGDPVAFVRSDGTSSIVYRGGGYTRSLFKDVIELHYVNSGWQAAVDINQQYNPGTVGSAVGDPVPYVRSDGYTAIVYRDLFNYLHEMTTTDGSWSVWSLSQTAGETR
jgi:hypothetical protein